MYPGPIAPSHLLSPRAVFTRVHEERVGSCLRPQYAGVTRAREVRGPGPSARRLTAVLPQFPHLILASVASSAPVRAVLDFSEYNEVRTAGGGCGGGRGCGEPPDSFSRGPTAGGVQKPNEHGCRRIPGGRRRGRPRGLGGQGALPEKKGNFARWPGLMEVETRKVGGF